MVANCKNTYVLAFYDCTRKRKDVSKLISGIDEYTTLSATKMALYES